MPRGKFDWEKNKQAFSLRLSEHTSFISVKVTTIRVVYTAINQTYDSQLHKQKYNNTFLFAD